MGSIDAPRAELKKAVAEKSFEGITFDLLEGPIKPGDFYLAQRNTGVKLLTCKKNDTENGWIEPVETAYLYDTHECVGIVLVL